MNENDTWSKRFKDWGALFVSAIVFSLLALGLIISAKTPDPTPAFTNLMETIKALSMLCAGFWVGSSNQGQRKDEIIAEQSKALAVSLPANMNIVSETNIGDSKTA